ncbi:MAG: gas vesicle protein K [Gemmatimonadetes bacterium]|nr:gas vesicle protein K [Gemmatimonadota bacterium]
MTNERARPDGGVDGAPTADLREVAPSLPARLEASPEDIEAGVGKLVLTLVEFIRQMLEHQAVRRMEGGALDDDEMERLGLALMRLEERLDDIRDAFGIDKEDLNIDLGPLGRLL